MLDVLKDHPAILYALGIGSLVMFFGSLFFVPPLLIRIPPDYFAHPRRPPSLIATRHPAARLAIKIARNLLGAILLLAGLAMLLLPGQGLVTLLIGLLVLDIPGKYPLERWLISRRGVLRAVNWLRKRHHHPPLKLGVP